MTDTPPPNPDSLHPLARWRQRHGHVQRHQARRLGVSGPTWSSWEAGAGRPSLAHALRLELLTSGEVTLEDWGYEPDALADAARVLAQRAGRPAVQPSAPPPPSPEGEVQS